MTGRTLHPARTISVSIARDPAEVYAYVVDPRNLPAWAPGFARAVRQDPTGWVVDTADGPVRLAFVPRNDLGVADHHVTDDAGLDLWSRMRVLPNGDGAEVLFTLFRTPDLTDAAAARDLELVQGDLRALQRLLEDPAG